MIVSINQPAYLPWLGYLHRIAISDLHIVLDHVQFEKNSFVNRNRVRTKASWCWLTVPVKTKGLFGQLPITQLEIAGDGRWNRKHYEALRTNYGRARFFAAHQPFLEKCYGSDWSRLVDLNRCQTQYLLDAFSIRTPVVFSSSLDATGKKDELVLELCRTVRASHYLSGPLGRNYLRESLFHDAGIGVSYHDFAHPVYAQLYPGFEPGMCALDLLLNHGPESARVLLSGDRPQPVFVN